MSVNIRGYITFFLLEALGPPKLQISQHHSETSVVSKGQMIFLNRDEETD